MTTPAFIPSLELSCRFYVEAVHPMLEKAIPGTPHSAALLGSGSEVLGFDTARARDHDWVPRMQLFLTPQDTARHGPWLRSHLAEHLPKTFHGYPTHFAPTGEEGGIGVLQQTHGPVRHRVDVSIRPPGSPKSRGAALAAPDMLPPC